MTSPLPQETIVLEVAYGPKCLDTPILKASASTEGYLVGSHMQHIPFPCLMGEGRKAAHRITYMEETGKKKKTGACNSCDQKP